ncbi:MAG: NigD-like protein [Bacteroidales bacterium]|nr:NigD-like protein [Bacteroidales bacterium]
MKKIFLIATVLTIIFAGCQEKEDMTFQETGVVVDYAGTDHCSFIIELDNGEKIQPLHFPEDFAFVQGQRVLVDYVKLPNVIPTCDKGIACDILNVEELDCGSEMTDLYAHNYDSLANDPVHLHEVAVDGDCLYLKLSFSGGCRNHKIELARIHLENGNEAEIPVLEIRHNAKGDMCEAWLTQEVQFDLTPLKEAGITQFQLKALLISGETYNEIIEME